MEFRDEVCALLLAEESRAMGGPQWCCFMEPVAWSGQEPWDADGGGCADRVGTPGGWWYIVRPSHLHVVKSVQT